MFLCTFPIKTYHVITFREIFAFFTYYNSKYEAVQTVELYIFKLLHAFR
jgi:hypothetical protein